MSKHIVRVFDRAWCLALLVGSAGMAHAASPCTGALNTGSVFTSGGDACQLVATSSSIDAIYIEADAGLGSTFALPGFGDVFTSPTSSSGDTVLAIPTTIGQLLNFTLTPSGGSEVFTAGVPASDGLYNAAYRATSEPGSLNIFSFAPGNSAYDYMDSHGGLAAWILIGWDDTISGDKDFNDMALAVHGATVLAVPEAGTVASLLGGLAMLALLRRRQQSN